MTMYKDTYYSSPTCFSDPDNMDVATELEERVDVVSLQVDVGRSESLTHPFHVEVQFPILRHLHAERVPLVQESKGSPVSVLLHNDVFRIHLVGHLEALVHYEVIGGLVLRAPRDVIVTVDVSRALLTLHETHQELLFVSAYAVVVRYSDYLHFHLGESSERPRAVADGVTSVVATAGY